MHPTGSLERSLDQQFIAVIYLLALICNKTVFKTFHLQPISWLVLPDIDRHQINAVDDSFCTCVNIYAVFDIILLKAINHSKILVAALSQPLHWPTSVYLVKGWFLAAIVVWPQSPV